MFLQLRPSSILVFTRHKQHFVEAYPSPSRKSPSRKSGSRLLWTGRPPGRFSLYPVANSSTSAETQLAFVPKHNLHHLSVEKEVTVGPRRTNNFKSRPYIYYLLLILFPDRSSTKKLGTPAKSWSDKDTEFHMQTLHSKDSPWNLKGHGRN